MFWQKIAQENGAIHDSTCLYSNFKSAEVIHQFSLNIAKSKMGRTINGTTLFTSQSGERWVLPMHLVIRGI